MKEKLKLLVKNTVPLVGELLLLIFGRRTNKDGYEKRILIMFGGGMGDVVKRSVIAGPIKDYLSDYEIHYLLPYDLPIPWGDRRHTFNYSKAKMSPFYYFSLVNRLRKIGFEKVIILLPFWEGFLSFLGTDTGAKIVYCDGMTPPTEFARSMERFNSFMHRRAVDRIVKSISVESGWDEGWRGKYFPSDVWRQASFISKIIKDIRPDLEMKNKFLLPTSVPLRTTLDIPRAPEATYLGAIHDKYALRAGKYCVMGLGSSSDAKNWPAENFAIVADFLWARGVRTVMIGGKGDMDAAAIFKKHCRADYMDLVGGTSLMEVCSLIDDCGLLVSNDTSFVHIAVALAKPSVCVIGGHDDSDSNYGYRASNRWVSLSKPGGSIRDVAVGDVEKAITDVLDRRDRDSGSSVVEFETSYNYNDLLELKQGYPL